MESLATLSKEELLQRYRTLGNRLPLTDPAAVESTLDALDQIESLLGDSMLPTLREDPEAEAGLYPDTHNDPLFIQKLLQKQEFWNSKQESIQSLQAHGADPCSSTLGFELSPVQRLIAQFLSPKTPFMSALLFHGVGVGKTCSAITVAERYLEMYPKKKVIIVAPRNIQPNFLREIFTETKLKMGEDEEPNQYLGCTGSTYLRLTGTEYSREKQKILHRVATLRAKRYELYGYQQFYNYLKETLEQKLGKVVSGEARLQKETDELKKLFSDRLIIIDEAHNLRDLTEGEDDLKDAPGGKKELTESQAGKKLTPYLRKLFKAAEGTKLLLLTATPMYNSYKEIIPLLNLMLINDKKAERRESDFFDANGSFLTPATRAKFGRIVQAYVSFMRGENPLSFPIRLDPEGLPMLIRWPEVDPLGTRIEDPSVRTNLLKLPFVPVEFEGQGAKDYRTIVEKLIVTGGLRLAATDGLVQAGNFLFPGAPGTPPQARIREQGFKGCFSISKDAKSYTPAGGISPEWLHEGPLAAYSPKCNLLLNRLKTTHGVTFVYSRFVYSGALAIALALEANGYEPALRSPLLKGAPLAPGGKQCALCREKEDTHEAADHSFKQAKYVLLTGRDELTPNNKESIDLATRTSNKDGGEVKVVVGSQVASEGIDLKFIREVLVFDSWYHLNKLEQVIGRGIRYCSHAALPVEKRNCTVALLVTTFPPSQKQETVDLYQYRIGFEKAEQIGQITRVMKEYAFDCTLNKDAILMEGLKPIPVLYDSQGEKREGVSLDDQPFSNVCDWIETCRYECSPNVRVNLSKLNTSTYDEYAARWKVYQVKELLRSTLEENLFIRHDNLVNLLLKVIPRVAIHAILREILNNKSFRIRVGDEVGSIVYRNGYYLFQPEKLKNTGVPLAMRTGHFPVKRDSYEEIEVARVARPPPVAAQQTRGEAGVEAPVAPSSVKAFWTASMSLLDGVRDGTLAPPRSDKKILSDTLDAALKQRYTGNKKAYDKAYNMISMIYRLYEDLQANAAWREAFAYSAGKFLWDELLTIEEQTSIYMEKKDSTDLFYDELWSEHILVFDGKAIYRRLNPSTGTVEYVCEGKPCSPALVSAIEAEDESTDPLRSLRANALTTGKPYGTVNYKNGLFVFKTNLPVKPSSDPTKREKQERGSECANVPNMVPHYKLLDEIGSIAEASSILHSRLGFTLEDLQDSKAPRSVKNSVRACALTDLALRFFDALEIDGKRWFYRPLASFYTKHPGILRASG
jgi:hypothetical protein